MIRFFVVNRGINVFPGKVKLKERSFSYSKMNTLLFYVFTFRVDCEMYSFVENEKYLFFEKEMNSLKFIQDKHYELSVAFDKQCRMFLFWLCTSHIDHDMFLLFDGKNDRCWMVLPFWTLSTLFGNAP